MKVIDSISIFGYRPEFYGVAPPPKLSESERARLVNSKKTPNRVSEEYRSIREEAERHAKARHYKG